MKKFIGLVGPIASGKGTVAEILKKMGYSYYSLSDRIREELTKNGQEINRESLQDVGNELREEFGNDILAKETAELIDKDNPGMVIIDSIRNPKEIEYLKNKYNIFVLGIIVSQKRRYELMIQRGRENEKISFEEFKKLDDKELENDKDYTQLVNETMKYADVIIENNGSIEDLEEKLKAII